MTAYVITLSNNEESVKSAEKTIESAKDVGYQFPIKKFEAIKPSEWNKILPYENEFHIYKRPDNVAACFASHYLLWKKCVELNEPILILEHDAIFRENIPNIDFNMCVNFGRPSYIRPHHMIYEETKDGLNWPNQVNFLGHHGYAIKPEAAKIFCEDVKTRVLTANDTWIERVTYPWLEEYRPFPIHADTDFTTVQMIEDLEEVKPDKKWEEITDVKFPYYEWLLATFPHILHTRQSQRHINA